MVLASWSKEWIDVRRTCACMTSGYEEILHRKRSSSVGRANPSILASVHVSVVLYVVDLSEMFSAHMSEVQGTRGTSLHQGLSLLWVLLEQPISECGSES